MSCNKKDFTLTHDEKVKGWTSFHSFTPDYMIGMNNMMFSFKNGDLYIHHSPDVPRNTFYGVQYPSKISLMINDVPSEVKALQAISIEGNNAWETLIKAFISNVEDYSFTTIKEVEFVKKEGIWYAYSRRNEDTNKYDSKATYGIGVVTEILSPNTVTVQGYNDSLTVGETITSASDMSVQGTITNIDTDGEFTTIEIDAPYTLAVGEFIFGMKDRRVEGGSLRGYTFRADLEITKNEKVELFAVNAEVMKSFT